MDMAVFSLRELIRERAKNSQMENNMSVLDRLIREKDCLTTH